MSRIKIFLSYVEDEAGRDAASSLRDELEKRYIEAIMAPERIPAGEDWAQWIKDFLEESSALVVVGTTGVSASAWCQQEIGWALGRHVPVLWVSYDPAEPPCGFLAFKQVLNAKSSTPARTAKETTNWLIRREKIRPLLADSWIEALGSSNSFNTSERTARLLARLGTVSPEQWERIKVAGRWNDQVRRAHYSGPGDWQPLLTWLEKELEVVSA